MSQPYGYRSRSARSLNQSVYSGYSTGTAASTGRIVRRTPAPRFHPFVIIVAVICIGMVIVGLIMTIIGNWPGYSSIGYNYLEIVGPVILGVGGLALICTIAVVVMRNRYQKEEWEMKMIDVERSRSMHASRMTMDRSQGNLSMSSKGPAKSILKKTPSTSTYGRNSNVFDDEGSDSGIAYTTNHGNQSFEHDSYTSDRGRPQQGYRVEAMPDPAAARRAQYGGYPNGGYPPQSGYTGDYNAQGGYPPQNGYAEQHSTDSESHVPVPIRVPKAKKKNTRQREPQYAQEAYATNNAPQLPRGESPLAGTPDIGGMSDRLSYTSDQEVVVGPNTPSSYQPQPPRTMQNYDAHQRSYDAFDPNLGQPGFNPPVSGYEPPTSVSQPKSYNAGPEQPTAEDLDRNTDARRSRRKKKKKPAATEGTEEENAPLKAAVPTAGGEPEYAKPKKKKKRRPKETDASAAPVQQSSPTLNRINISAQPGTSVSITPGGPQYNAAPIPHNFSRGSAETEI